MNNTYQVVIALALTLFAGLATCVGGALALTTNRTNTRLLSVALGFSAGVMIYVSFVELLAQAMDVLETQYGHPVGTWYAVLGFFGGIALIGIIDRFVPELENPHEFPSPHGAARQPDERLLRTGVMAALAISVHNFPEGMATFLATLQDVRIGGPIAVAIAIHNVPEGIAVAVPVYFATGSKRRAFGYATLSGVAEPVGALIGFLVLAPFLDDLLMGVMFAFIAGVMVFVSLDELLPSAETYGEHHLSMYGLIGGMAVMAVSLLLLMS